MIKETHGLSTNTLKIWAIVAMVCDHFPYMFANAHSVYYQEPMVFFHAFGRITAPVFFYLAAIGLARTRNAGKYTARLLLFALISYVPYIWYFKGSIPNNENFLNLNVIFSMLFGVLMLRSIHEITNLTLRFIACAGCVIGSLFSDYGLFGLAMVLVFAYSIDGVYGVKNPGEDATSVIAPHVNKAKLTACFSAVLITSIYTNVARDISDLPPLAIGEWFVSNPIMVSYLMVLLAQFLPLFVILTHRDPLQYQEPRPGFFGKWFFYIFYPAHISILLAVRIFVIEPAGM